ncbi:hypothetical protein BDV26DRAFT_292662 [Aspergillus bertholletiae]|uniref:Uncharacterized protein n=1 Tax=Aspergillus bertholletiae TaxID=1226010 RepID=A0A5N7B8I3_9EURO|nr:hypothetical protein BDV26DRAFT_292662 [Aspergillus bertholletiae]
MSSAFDLSVNDLKQKCRDAKPAPAAEAEIGRKDLAKYSQFAKKMRRIAKQRAHELRDYYFYKLGELNIKSFQLAYGDESGYDTSVCDRRSGRAPSLTTNSAVNGDLPKTRY